MIIVIVTTIKAEPCLAIVFCGRRPNCVAWLQAGQVRRQAPVVEGLPQVQRVPTCSCLLGLQVAQ